MRPRVFPAEDAPSDGAPPFHNSASMRPRVFPAEDHLVESEIGRCHTYASMRPRVFPAEDVGGTLCNQDDSVLQ